jgi:hypothetical protein
MKRHDKNWKGKNEAEKVADWVTAALQVNPISRLLELCDRFCKQFTLVICGFSACISICICQQRFVEQMLMLSSSFRRDQIYKCQRYNFGHTLICYLSPDLMFNKPTSGLKMNNANFLNTNEI